MQQRIAKSFFWIPLLLALALASPASPAAAVEASPFGINIHAPQGEELNALLDRVQAAGIGWVRIDFIWAWVEPARDTYDWRVYDAIVAAARARGIEVFATLAYTPAWATSGPAVTGVPNDPGQWAEVCSAAAQQFRGKIRYWGVWNEPNLAKFWSGSRQQYLDILLKPCADAIHAANPAAQVGGPDLAHLTSGDSDWYDWLNDVLVAAGDRLDFITHHVYDSDGHRDVGDRLDGSTVFGNRPSLWDVVNPSVEEVLRNAGAWGKPFWLTETGWDSANSGETQQASWYGGLLNDWLTGAPERSWLNKVFFYELADGPPPAPGWGILRADRSARPAYDTYRAFIAAHTPRQDNAAPVSATFPDTMEAGQPAVVRLTFRNTGTTAWTDAEGYRLAAAEDLDPFTDPRQLLTAGESIAPNTEKTFSFEITAPPTPGTYRIRWQMLREGFDRFGTAFEQELRVLPAPSVAERTLRLMNDQFRVTVSWHDPASGRAGFGRAVPGPDPTGYFWFFNSTNLELVVKALDGRPVNGQYWLFYGALSDVEYWVDVTETRTGRTKRYHNPSGSLCGRGDTSAFSGNRTAVPFLAGASAPLFLDAPVESPAAATTCVADAQTLCLLGGRFRVSVEWQTRDGATGRGAAVPQSGVSGTFWFFGPENIELVVKVLDGRVLNNRYWFFYGALSDVQYTITVLDTVTGVRKRYRNPAGNLCGKGDTDAFAP
jgi:polysaccharide biosynthesis protein PslG